MPGPFKRTSITEEIHTLISDTVSWSFRAVATGQFSGRLVTMKHPPARALKSRFTPSYASLESALSKIKAQRPINTRRRRGKAGSANLPQRCRRDQ